MWLKTDPRLWTRVGGIVITLLRDDRFSGEQTTLGDSSDRLPGRAPGSYTVSEAQPTRLRFSTTPNEVTVALGAGETHTVNFGDWNGRPT